MIILKPEAGLCNRLRAIASAIKVAERTHQKLVVFWQTDYAMNALFSELFEKPKAFRLVEMRVPRNRLMLGLVKHLNAFLFKTRPPLVYSFRSEADFVARCQRMSGRRQVVVLSSFLPFAEDRDYDWLRLKPDMAAQIENAAILSRGRIGVHIRRTDNRDAMAASPLESFYARIQKAAAEDPTCTFYVASDDDSVKKHLQDQYPGRVFCRDKVAARDAKDGVRDAVVDLWLLATSKKLFGSRTSSFSEEASRIGHVDVEWIGGGVQ